MSPFAVPPSRNPFLLGGEPLSPPEDLTPLLRYPLEELRLRGVAISSGGERRAVVELPSGRSYSVGLNSRLGRAGGVVRELHMDRIAVERDSVSGTGAFLYELALYPKGSTPNSNFGASR